MAAIAGRFGSDALLAALATAAMLAGAAWPARAEAESSSDRFSVVAQRVLPTGKEQRAFIFDGETVQLVANSNFLDGSTASARLGLFESPLVPVLKARRDELFEIKRRLDLTGRKTHGAGDESLSPHHVRYFVGGHELGPGAQYRETVEAVLDRAFLLADWKAKDAVEVRSVGKGLVKLSYQGSRSGQVVEKAAELGCGPSGTGLIRCPIAGFGSAYLKE